MNEEDYHAEFLESIKQEWSEIDPATQAVAEGTSVEFDLLLNGAVAESRIIRSVIAGEIDKSLHKVTMLVMLSDALSKILDPEPDPDFSSVLAAAAVRIMTLEDELDSAHEEIVQLKGGVREVGYIFDEQ